MPAEMIKVCQEEPRQQAARQLLAASDAYSTALYPEESRHPADVESLALSNVRFLVGRLNGEPVGCVALVISDDRTAELKRMIVFPETRGRGIGSRLLRRVEAAAVEEGIDTIRLETGPKITKRSVSIGVMAIGPGDRSDDTKLDPIASSLKNGCPGNNHGLIEQLLRPHRVSPSRGSPHP